MGETMRPIDELHLRLQESRGPIRWEDEDHGTNDFERLPLLFHRHLYGCTSEITNCQKTSMTARPFDPPLTCPFDGIL